MKATTAKLRQLQPGKSETIELWGSAVEESGRGPRYTLKVIDVPSSSSNAGSRSSGPLVAAFIVPQGREHEYLFSTEDGLRQIADSAGCARLLSVTLMRGHRFESLEGVKEEISSAIVEFSPEGVEGKIQVMTTADSLGNRDVVATGRLAASGDEFFVEESDIDGGLVRRLVFAANPTLIQTEVRLLRSSHDALAGGGGGGGGGAAGGGGSKKNKGSGGKKKKKGKAKAAAASSTAAPPGDELGDSEIATSSSNSSSTPSGVLLDNSFLCFEYHRAIVAGLVMCEHTAAPKSTGGSEASGEPSPPPPPPSGVVIGLGGGALPMSLHHFFPHVPLTVVELDASVVEVATQWFGFVESPPGLRTLVGDGLEADLGAGAQAFVVVDVDSKDTSVGMSCPPQAFLAAPFLAKIKAALVAGGVLAVNVAARSAELYRQALSAVRDAFAGDGAVYFLKAAEDDVNTVIFAVKGSAENTTFSVTSKPAAQTQKKKKKPASSSSGASGGGGAATEVNLKSRIRSMLLSVPEQSSDPLGLLEMIEGLKLA